MKNRTLQALIVHVFLFGCSTVSLAWAALAYLYSDGPMWAPIANGIIWLVSLCGAGLCYRELGLTPRTDHGIKKDWINKQLGRLSYAEGIQSVALGALFGFLVALAFAAFNGVSAGWMIIAAFAGSILGSVVMTTIFCLLAAASRRHLTVRGKQP